MRIVTVTLNPALDKTAALDVLLPGELNRLQDLTVDAGGKGINVSKMIRALGGTSIATGFLGGGGEAIAHSLDEMGVSHDFVRIQAATRTNMKVLDRGSRLTELNEPGPVVTPDEVQALRVKLREYAGDEGLFVFSGSVPRGVGPEIYFDLIRMVKQAGATAFLDADGVAFAKALPAGPDFIKPNRFELLRHYSDPEGGDMANVLRYCRILVMQGIKKIALSMGEEGALFVTGDDAFFCPGLKVAAHSSVGAGDSMVGAVAYATAAGMPWRDAATLAMAASAGAVTTVGTKAPTRELVDSLAEQVRIEGVDEEKRQ